MNVGQYENKTEQVNGVQEEGSRGSNISKSDQVLRSHFAGNSAHNVAAYTDDRRRLDLHVAAAHKKRVGEVNSGSDGSMPEPGHPTPSPADCIIHESNVDLRFFWQSLRFFLNCTKLGHFLIGFR